MKYHPFYCEENVWHLADEMREMPGRRARVLFISNVNRACAMFKQLAGDPIVWDYHVVLYADGEIYDRDSRLDFPAPLRDWMSATFPIPLPKLFAPRFRVIDADRFLKVFASDRSHMRTQKGWRSPPPPWPPILPIGQGTNLMRFVDMEHEFEGTLVDLAQLASALCG